MIVSKDSWQTLQKHIKDMWEVWNDTLKKIIYAESQESTWE